MHQKAKAFITAKGIVNLNTIISQQSVDDGVYKPMELLSAAFEKHVTLSRKKFAKAANAYLKAVNRRLKQIHAKQETKRLVLQAMQKLSWFIQIPARASASFPMI